MKRYDKGRAAVAMTICSRAMAFALFCAVAIGADRAVAQPASDDGKGTFNVQVENDLFGSGSDRNYTNGLRLSYLSPQDEIPGWVYIAARSFPLFAEQGLLRTSYTIGQNMYTPDDTSRPDLIRDDRPYAGWLYGGVGLTSDNGQILDNLELDIGVVGPASFAEDTQKIWHKLIGADRPEGWDNQLRNEPAFVLFYERKWRAMYSFNLDGLAVDATPHAGMALGTVYTHGAGGITFRFGQDLPSDYGPPRIRPSLPGSGFFVPTRSFGWYLFAGVEGRAVGRNIFLDGNTFTDSHSVDKEVLVGDFQAGIAFTVGDARLSYTYVVRTREFQGQDQPDQFGSFNLSLRF